MKVEKYRFDLDLEVLARLFGVAQKHVCVLVCVADKTSVNNSNLGKL